MSNFRTPPDRTLVYQSRPHDFLYDPNYIMPSREDFLKDAAVGTKSGARVVLKPVYESFFSDIKTDQRIQPCLTIPRPSNIESFVPQYDINGMPIMPMDSGPLPLPRQVDDVTGADRAKYGIKYGTTSYQMHREPFDFNKLSPEEKKKILQTQKTQRSGYISRGIQTDQRDSECQTDPYSPPYRLSHPGVYPKVLALQKLTWAKGLPFTLDDIVVIERALSRRILEHTDRIGEDQEGFETRIKLMEELEAQQWADREKELEKVLQFKMEITSKLLYDYSAKLSTEHTMRLERLQAILRARNSKHLENVRHQYFRNLRKLEKKYFEPQPSRKRNIIKDYTEFDSSIYAPLVRNGISIDILNPAPPFQFDLHRDFESFQEVTESKSFIRKEISFDMEAFKNRVKQCEPTAADQRLERKLEKIYTSFKDWNLPRKINPLDHLEVRVTEENEGHAGIPLITLDGEDEERQRRPHCITLQKIGRGRAIQQLIRSEIEANMNELIGMKYMFDMDPNCQLVEEGMMQKLLAIKRFSDAEASRDTEVKEVLGHLEGETLNKMLDYLDKEMIRLIDERKIHALILMAERERRRKEAMEAGRRSREEEVRRANDEIFRQVVGIHQSTVDMYLEDILIESCDRAADEESRNHVRQMAALINETAYSLPTDLGEFEKEEMAAELVSGYIVPELSRLAHQECLDATASNYKKAATDVLQAVFGAHELVRQVVTFPLPPVVEELNLMGASAVDGSLNAVDCMIKGAVFHVLKAENDAARKVAAKAAKAAAAEAARKAKEEEGIEIPDFVMPDLDPEAMLELGITTRAEDIEKPEMEIKPFFKDPPIVLKPGLKSQIAAKALGVHVGLDPCEVMDTFESALEGAVNEIILAARRVVAPDPPEKEEIEVPVDESNDDNDDK